MSYCVITPRFDNTIYATRAPFSDACLYAGLLSLFRASALRASYYYASRLYAAFATIRHYAIFAHAYSSLRAGLLITMRAADSILPLMPAAL